MSSINGSLYNAFCFVMALKTIFQSGMLPAGIIPNGMILHNIQHHVFRTVRHKVVDAGGAGSGAGGSPLHLHL